MTVFLFFKTTKPFSGLKAASTAIIIFLLSFACYGFSVSRIQEQSTAVVMDFIAECQFDKAVFTVDSMIAYNNAEPLYRMLKLSVLALRELDFADTCESDEFDTTYKNAMEVLAACEKQSQWDEEYLLTLKGFIQFVAASHTMYRKKYLSGLRTGLDAVSICNDVKKKDSSNVDVDFIRGLYNYARAELKRRFWGFLFWYSGDKRSGIHAMEYCRDNALIVATPAAMILQDVYVKEGMYDSAYAGTNRILAKFPHCRFALWSKAKLFDAQKKYSGAAQVYGMLAGEYEDVPGAYKNLKTTLFLEAQSFFLAGEKENAEAVLKRLLGKCNNNSCEQCNDAEKLLKKLNSAK
jgi:tetratricopeptide (TPR) repeat protein